MSRQKSGSAVNRKGKLYARVRFVDDKGKKRDLWRIASGKEDAKKKVKALLKEAETKSSTELDASKMRFNQLADFYEANYLQKPVYCGDRKIIGLRHSGQANSQLKVLKSHFGDYYIQSITYADIAAFKLKRLSTPTRLSTKQRSIASVNRELQRLRRVLNIAIRQEWLIKSPFKSGDSLINPADEMHRDRILTIEEESQILFEIDSEPKRKHLKGIVLIALDTALRCNEIITLCKKDVNFADKTITIRAFNAKTARTRKVGATKRVFEWLNSYCRDLKADDRIFPFSSFKTAWKKVVVKSKIDNLRFHDLRHTSISRMIKAGLPHTEVMRVSGIRH